MLISPQRQRRVRRDRSGGKDKEGDRPCREEKGQRRGKRKGGGGGRVERNHPCVPPGLSCKSAGTSTSVLDAFTLHLLSASQPFLLHRILETYWSSCPFSDLAWSLSSQGAFLHSLFPLSEMLFPLSTITL